MHTTTTTPPIITYGVPEELLEGGVRRLGVVSLGLAALVFSTVALCHIARHTEWADAASLLNGFSGNTIAAFLIALSMAMAALCHARIANLRLLLDVSAVYAGVCSLGIAALENLVYWPSHDVTRGVSWVCLWIVLFPLMVPATAGKTFLTAFTSACMGPLAYLIMVAMGQQPGSALAIAGLFMPNFAAVVLAMVVSRAFYKLGKRVSEARQMGNYRLVERLGQGGMGEVWRADHRRLAKSAAIKFIRRDCIGDAHTRLVRFEREASATAQLRSPHTVELYDFGATADGTLYHVMELLSGLDSESLVRRFGPLPAARATFLLQQVCSSLAEAHQVGLVHRDIKPANLFVCHLGLEFDFVKVLDFGLVRSTLQRSDTRERLTVEGMLGGTPAYVAPEMITGTDDIDNRADIYAVGCVAYWMLTGELVFHGSSMNVIMEHVHAQPVPPSQRTELEVPRQLEAIVLSCLEKDPANRPQNAQELANQLASCAINPPWTPERARAWWNHHMPTSRAQKVVS